MQPVNLFFIVQQQQQQQQSFLQIVARTMKKGAREKLLELCTSLKASKFKFAMWICVCVCVLLIEHLAIGFECEFESECEFECEFGTSVLVDCKLQVASCERDTLHFDLAVLFNEFCCCI